MSARALLVATGLLAASIGPALSDSVTATVSAWDAASRTITLEDFSQFASIPATVKVPDVAVGDQVTVDYIAYDNGYDTINSITVIKDIAKRLNPNDKRG
jgi:RNase H-fold protein (predicted Holliday junction resolvase)